MGKFTELPIKAQLGIVIGAAFALTVVLYFGFYKSIADQNKQTAAQVTSLENENAYLRTFEPKLNELAAQIENLKVQLERQRQIVPDEKEAPRFMHLVQAQAAAAGIEIRRYTAKPTSTREFYVEVPFEIELDGSYYSLVNFFERVAKVERIINISGLKMATVNDPKEANPKRRYQYAPSESVVATCTATTFFSSQAAAVQSGSAGGR